MEEQLIPQETNDTDRIIPVNIEEQMKTAYIDYSMSVIVGRALPDVRDGLKPVHRRILYSMFDSGLQPGRPHRKCANVVGGVMGNYHPHGDSAIYDALVRLGQDFAMRHPLVDSQGNFGSIDNDPPAAMRYTEARLARLATEMLRDIDADTVEFGANFDDPEIEVAGLMRHVKGPDFPTGGIISGRQGIKEAYETGRGRLVVKARAHIEPLRQGKEAIVVTEMPYQVAKGDGRNEGTGLIKKIAEIVQSGKVKEISDLRDESDRSGIRLVIELK